MIPLQNHLRIQLERRNVLDYISMIPLQNGGTTKLRFRLCFRLHKYDTATKQSLKEFKKLSGFRLHKYDTATKPLWHYV